MLLQNRIVLAASALFAACTLHAMTTTVEVTLSVVSSEGIGKSIGTVTFADSEYGLMITPDLRGLHPGPHAAHIHEKADCGPSADGVPGGAAGDHYDPSHSNKHAGPFGDGHLGDLPNLIIDQDGIAILPVLAPRITVADIKGRALLIHAGADHYSDHATHRHGKGGDRMYCGVVE